MARDFKPERADQRRALLQLALDTLEVSATLRIIGETAEYTDILEIGTPCIKHNGIALVKLLKQEFPKKTLLVDLKTMDAGEYESTPFYAAGADICTVLGVAGPATIAGVAKAARAHGARVQVDLINVPNKLACAEQSIGLGVDIIGIHTGIDAQAKGQTPFADLRALTHLHGPLISVAGGINASTVGMARDAGADIVVVGGAITGSRSPSAAARAIRDGLKRDSVKPLLAVN